MRKPIGYTGWQTGSTMSSTRPCERDASQRARIGRKKSRDEDKHSTLRSCGSVMREVNAVLRTREEKKENMRQAPDANGADS